eukprot:3887190-Heterocapsa_arctica.AAC.1
MACFAVQPGTLGLRGPVPTSTFRTEKTGVWSLGFPMSVVFQQMVVSGARSRRIGVGRVAYMRSMSEYAVKGGRESSLIIALCGLSGAKPLLAGRGEVEVSE